jgi:hypothetical protein
LYQVLEYSTLIKNGHVKGIIAKKTLTEKIAMIDNVISDQGGESKKM